jgi:ElaA protein
VRGTGIGVELMRRGMAEVERLYGTVPVRISAQSYLLRFYSSFGFSPVGEEYLEDDIPHTEMLYTP